MDAKDLLAKRIASKTGENRNYASESQAQAMKDNKKVLLVEQDSNMNTVDLTLEPDKFDELSTKSRLTMEEFINAIGEAVQDEEKSWHELRMKDQVNMARDHIIRDSILKYAKEHEGIDREDYGAIDLNYIKRVNENGSYIGEAIMVSLAYRNTL